jgi:hypothetical protein
MNAGKAGLGAPLDVSRFKKSPVKKKATGEFHAVPAGSMEEKKKSGHHA